MILPTAGALPRIAHVISGLSTGGAELMLLKLVRGGSPSFSHVVVSLSATSTVGPLLEEAGAQVHALNLNGGPMASLNVVRLVGLLEQLAPNLIQGWMYHGNVTASGARALMKTKSSLSWSIRCSLNISRSEKWLTRGIVKAGAFISRGPSSIVYNSNRSKAEHEGIGYSGSHAIVIPNGFDTGTFKIDDAARRSKRQRLAIPSNSVVVGLLARNHPIKDHRTFLTAAIKVLRERSDVIFVAAGADIPRLAASMPDLVGELGPRLMLMPEQSDIPAFMNALDISVLSSLEEGFPNVLGEAMACGVPCIATDVGDCAAIVADTGVIVPPRSPEMLASAIMELASAGPDRRRALGAEARERVVDHYSLENAVRLYEDVWRRAIELRTLPASGPGRG